MVILPRPAEPSRATLAKHARGAGPEARDFVRGGSEGIDLTTAQIGVTGYLWSHWETCRVSYQSLRDGTQRLEPAIGRWLDEEDETADWAFLLRQYEAALGHSIDLG